MSNDEYVAAALELRTRWATEHNGDFDALVPLIAIALHTAALEASLKTVERCRIIALTVIDGTARGAK